MSYLNNSKRVAICGLGGIGKVHARILNTFGAQICAILGSTTSSTKKAIQELKNSLNIIARPYIKLDALLKHEKPDAIFICTPPEFHFHEIINALDHGVAIFCEKPFFWHNDINIKEIDQNLNQIRKYEKRLIFVNTCNTYFVDRVVNDLYKPKDTELFYFRYYTQGKHSGNDIAIDLLPHGLSMLLRLIGEKPITEITQFVRKDSYICQFLYGNCKVVFEFKEQENGPKNFYFRFILEIILFDGFKNAPSTKRIAKNINISTAGTSIIKIFRLS